MLSAQVRCHGGGHGETTCHNCERLKFACSFRADHAAADAKSSTASTLEADRPEPRRVSKACLRCREHKIRCSGARPCATCRAKGVSCEYTATARSRPPRQQRRQRSVSHSVHDEKSDTIDVAGPTSSMDDALSEDKEADALPSLGATAGSFNDVSASSNAASTPPGDLSVLIDFFFEHVYPLPSYAFLHPATTRKRFVQGKLEPCLMYAIMASASVRSPPLQRRLGVESAWAEKAETLIWQTLDSPSLARVQALLLITLFRAETGHLRRAFMLSGLAGRSAAAMRLNYERHSGNKTSMEVRRRLMWSLKLVERYFSIGLSEFELCPVENMYIQLPCREQEFNNDMACGSDDDLGSYHICVELEMLRRDVMKLTRSLMLCDEAYLQLSKLMRDFQTHLDRIGSQLPGGPEVSSEGMRDLLDDRWLSRHLLMRLSWHECHCDLYRLLLRDFREAAPQVVIDGMDPEIVNVAEDVCIHHAKAIVLVLGTVNNESQQARLLEFDTAICAYNASRLLLFTARFGRSTARPTDEFALSRAELCFAALRRFFPESRLVKPILGEIRRLINEFLSSGTPSPSRLGSPRIPTQYLPEPSKQLSSAAKTRQRLAVHSLLRQAGFNEEDDEPDDSAFVVSPPVAQPQLVSPGIVDPSAQPEQLPADPGYAATVAGDFIEQTTPETQVDSESWKQDFFAGGDLLHGWEFDNYTDMNSSLNHRSFIFPWLQRDQAE